MDRRLEGNGVSSANGHRADKHRPCTISDKAARLRLQWQEDPRWASVERSFSAEDVVRLRGSVQEEHTLARLGAERLWKLLHADGYVAALGALTGNQAGFTSKVKPRKGCRPSISAIPAASKVATADA